MNHVNGNYASNDSNPVNSNNIPSVLYHVNGNVVSNDSNHVNGNYEHSVLYHVNGNHASNDSNHVNGNYAHDEIHLILDHHDNLIKDGDLPATIASNIPEYQLEALRGRISEWTSAQSS